MKPRLGVQLFLKGWTLAMCGKNKYEKKINVSMIPWSLHTKDKLQSLATKKANISELLCLRYLPKCMISQLFSVSFV